MNSIHGKEQFMKLNFKKIGIVFALILIFTLSACSIAEIESVSVVTAKQVSASTGSTISVVYDSNDEDSSWNSSDLTYITLKGDSIILDGDGAVVDGNKVAITSAGTYYITGALDDGQIVVKTDDKDTVKLILYGVDITCTNNAPLYIYNAKKTVITLAEGTENYITDGATYSFADSTSDEPNAAIFSKDDLTINGAGSLTVNANYHNGIQSKDDLKITGGNITVTAVNDGIKGRDSIALKNATISVNAGGDGMQSTNDGDSEKGYIVIESGTLNITAGGDGIQAETNLNIGGGEITISSGGGSINSRQVSNSPNRDWGNTSDSVTSTVSAKGLKAAVNITIEYGTVTVDSSDDSINSNDSVTINGGTIVLASGDDGIHADSSIEINGGDIRVTKSYEGMESASLTINEGTIHLASSDDGINIKGENDGFPMNGGPGQNAGFTFNRRPDRNNNPQTGDQPDQNNNPPTDGQQWQDTFSSSGDYHLVINGGYLAVDANGDGIDVNGTVEMNGGTVIVHGPTSNNNGALDHNSFTITGGFLVAAGSSGMAQGPGTSSTQYSVLLNFESSQTANTLIHIETEEGEDILTFAPTKTYQSVVLSSPELKNGSTYIVYTGGSATGEAIDGLYSGGTYTEGTQIESFTISSIVTTIGSSRGGFPGGMPGGMRR
jgi:hypothetical protein